MRDGMRKAIGVLFYHSSCDVPGVAGIAEVATCRVSADPTQFDPKAITSTPAAARRTALGARRRQVQAQAQAHDHAGRTQGRTTN
jgi:predicted RNA-binding protein with PUA-like domain